ncbi:hypothetical protein KM043_008836 [Ampulex compressa]|nr:hypothetical protein KM043_008836 [Ampulex compressa]
MELLGKERGAVKASSKETLDYLAPRKGTLSRNLESLAPPAAEIVHPTFGLALSNIPSMSRLRDHTRREMNLQDDTRYGSFFEEGPASFGAHGTGDDLGLSDERSIDL